MGSFLVLRRAGLLFGLCIALGCGGDSPRAGGDLGRARRAGAQAGAAARAELGQVELPALAAYLERLVSQLAARAPELVLEWRVAVLDLAEPLSAGFEGGHLLLSRGLLVEIPDQRALLRVLATEMAHVALGHAAQRLEDMAAREPRAAPGAAAALVLPGLGRPLASVGTLRDLLEAVPYGPEARLAAAPLVASMLAAPEPALPEALRFPRALAGLAVGEDPRQGVVLGRQLLHPELDLAVAFPAGWPIINRSDFVAAFAPDAEARVVFQWLGSDANPLEAARAFAQGGGARFGLLPRAREISGRPGARAWGSTGDATLDVSWVVHGERLYQVTGVCPPEAYERLQVDFIDVALSLEALAGRSPASFEPVLLHVEAAPSGETLEQLLARGAAPPAWDAARIATLEGVMLSEPLSADRWIRIPRRAPLAPVAGTLLESPP